MFSGLTSNDFGYVYLNVASMPEGISEYAFTQGKTPYTELTESDGTTLEKVVCIGAVKKRKAVIIHIVGELSLIHISRFRADSNKESQSPVQS